MTEASRSAIVTGASRGIGAAVAERLARDGIAGHVLDMGICRSNCSTKFIAVDEQANHNIVQPDRFGEANRFSS
ncbi:hypothetical protein AVDCRST_MAG94-4755 [uncultured Leptolyngbya sp.]|uniref:3-oxoacyl-[acyl-carrier-protein] reductase n=1 Tax=uncultured Leptolyngbya sp. TaxID=332963 RepID=A0A6J4NCJ9_9CYAN|nr:hypothetical protein AVDCRST_MAG94-4755 [uncultured Leptolyngbya sp.]